MQLTNDKLIPFADHLLTQFERGVPVSSTQLLVKQAALFDIQPGTDYTNFKTLYDTAELAMNWYLSRKSAITTSIADMTETIDQAMFLLPVETERSALQSLYQQFSTPMDVAWMMALLAQLNKTSVVLDPSAGTGSLLSYNSYFNPALTLANEICILRNSLLSHSGYDHCFKEDATMIHFMPKFAFCEIDRIIMNPPFSRSHLTGPKKDLQAGARHLIAAYELLKPGGRMVILINETFNITSKAWKFFISKIKNPHIPINAAIHPTAFRKKGTTFPTRIIVIDKGHSSASVFNHDYIDLSLTLSYLDLK